MIDRGINANKMTYNSLIMGNFSEGKLTGVKDLVNDLKVKGFVHVRSIG